MNMANTPPKIYVAGFVMTSESADFLYETTNYYAPEHERCIRWNAPDLAIDWPPSMPPLLSPRDSNAPLLRFCELPD